METPRDREHADTPDEAPRLDATQRIEPIPQVPATPPAVVPGTSAQAMFFQWAIWWFALTITVIAVARVTASLLPGWASALTVGLAALSGLWWQLSHLEKVGNRAILEFQHGYYTLHLAHGGYWVGSGPTNIVGDLMLDWNYDCLWQLSGRDGAVARAPKRPVGPGCYPPGLYLSPLRPNEYQLWTGCQWASVYRASCG